MFSKFSLQIHKKIYEEYSQTFFVGGAVRNMFLKKKVFDFDIATSAIPSEVIRILKQNKITVSDEYKNMGVVIARRGKEKIEITTFRKEAYTIGRFPKVNFVESAKTDSKRRDFTVNALYYNPISKELLDYHGGLNDLKNSKLKFIGNAQKRIKEDPLRIVRAYRFQLQYKFKIDANTQLILNKNKTLLNSINKKRISREINVVTTKKLQLALQKVIHNIS